MFPSFITLTVSHRSATTPRLWVTSSMASPRSSLSSRSSSSTSACTVTSRAVVGSSATMMSGSAATAPQMSTRWAMPPEISWGYSPMTRSGSVIPTRVSRSMIRCRMSLSLSDVAAFSP